MIIKSLSPKSSANSASAVKFFSSLLHRKRHSNISPLRHVEHQWTKKSAEHNTRRFIDPDEKSRLQLLEPLRIKPRTQPSHVPAVLL